MRVIDQHPAALVEDRVVGGVPGHGERFGDARDREVLHDDGLQRPPQRCARQSSSRLGRRTRVLPPHPRAVSTAEATNRDQQRRRPPPERLMRQAPGNRVARDSLAASPAAHHRSNSPASTRHASTARSGSNLRADRSPTRARAALLACAEATGHLTVRGREGVADPRWSETVLGVANNHTDGTPGALKRSPRCWSTVPSPASSPATRSPRTTGA